MKSILIIFCILVGQLNIGTAQTFDNPIAYFDFFNQQHSAIVQENLNYLQVVVHSEDVELLIAKRLELLKLINQVEEQLNQLPDYDIDAGLKPTMQEVLLVYKTLYQEAYLEIEALKPQAQQSFELMQTYIDNQSMAEKQLADASHRFLEAQKAFATANGIVLIEGQSSSETEQLNELNNYQRALFLSSFRINKLNAAFLESMNTAKEESMNVCLDQLLVGCTEELEKVEGIAGFNQNVDYRNAVQKQVETIENMAKSDYPILIKGAVNSSALTAEEVDQYNGVITKINTTLNPLMEQINNSLQALLKANVPKPAHRGVKEI